MKVGSLTVEGPVDDPLMRCRCNCGTVIEVRLSELEAGKRRGCKRGRPCPVAKVTNGGLLTVIGKDATHVLCACACGNTKRIWRSVFKRSPPKSCGCVPSGRRVFRDLTGTRIGQLTVLERVGTNWRCVCNCGVEVLRQHRTLLLSKSNSCGCLKKRDHNAPMAASDTSNRGV